MQSTESVGEFIENRTFEEIAVGDAASLERRLTMRDIKLFAVMSGDVNPAHVDEDYAKSSRFHEIIAHGMWGGALISTVLGTQLPGPGTIYVSQTLRFRRPVGLGDVVRVSVRAKEKRPDKRRIIFECECTNQDGERVLGGEAEVIAPAEKVRRPRAVLPDVRLAERAHLHRLLEAAKGLAPMRTAVVHPVEAYVLKNVVQAWEARLMEPVLIGPAARIQEAAQTAGVDLSPFRLVSTEHSHAAAAEAVRLARSGEAEGLLEGGERIRELLQAVLAREGGLRTARRLSHIYAFDVPTYPRPLFITDAAINVYPTLEHKRDIVQNAVDLAHALGVDEPKVAILSAVETVTPKIPSTLEAAALCKMAERRQITGAMVDGPLAFDDAVSDVARSLTGLESEVAGKADILVVPDLESGSMLAEQLRHLGDAHAAGVILGARVPIVSVGPGDDGIGVMASCALALLRARHPRRPSV